MQKVTLTWLHGNRSSITGLMNRNHKFHQFHNRKWKIQHVIEICSEMNSFHKVTFGM